MGSSYATEDDGEMPNIPAVFIRMQVQALTILH